MNKVIFPGTFDPPTFGHLDILKRASQLFDHVYVAIGLNTLKKSPYFTIDERFQFLKTISQAISNIEIVTFKGLLVDFAQELEVNAILRAIRSASDFEYENIQAQINRQLADIKTIYGCRRTLPLYQLIAYSRNRFLWKEAAGFYSNRNRTGYLREAIDEEQDVNIHRM